MMHYFVNVTFANIYRKPSFHSEVDTQAVFWEKLELLERIDPFLHVQTEDHYEGWINEHQVAVCNPPNGQWKLVTRLVNYVYQNPETSSNVITPVGAGSVLPVVEEQGHWCKILLPDENEAFILKEAFRPIAGFNREHLVKLANQFKGITYIWGGKTPFGLDCSGFIQLTFKLLGKKVRRDAWMQFEDAQFVSRKPEEAMPGDLYFFSENGTKITHVGIALGHQKFIHARGMVRINSLDETDPDFLPELLRDFVEVRTYFEPNSLNFNQ